MTFVYGLNTETKAKGDCQSNPLFPLKSKKYKQTDQVFIVVTVVDPCYNVCSISSAPKALSSGYLVPDDFQQRNLELIQSIKKYLNNDESKFNQFKNYSAQFRQVPAQIKASVHFDHSPNLCVYSASRV